MDVKTLHMKAYKMNVSMKCSYICIGVCVTECMYINMWSVCGWCGACTYD